MATSKLTSTDKSDDSAAKVSAQSKRVRSRRRTMVQNVLLIWLNSNIDGQNADYQNTLTQLRNVVYIINTYMDGHQCVEFLQTMKNDKVYMIISGSLGQHIVPWVHSIFIFRDNEKHHE